MRDFVRITLWHGTLANFLWGEDDEKGWLAYSTYLYLDFHLCSMTTLTEHSREICYKKIAFALKSNSHWWFMRQNITMVNIDEEVWWNNISGTARSGDRVSPCSSEVFFFANCLTNSILEKIQTLTSSSSLFSGKIYPHIVCATYFMRQKLNQPQHFLSHAFLGFLDMRNFCQCGFHLSFLFWGWS